MKVVFIQKLVPGDCPYIKIMACLNKLHYRCHNFKGQSEREKEQEIERARDRKSKRWKEQVRERARDGKSKR